jgi:hypothetical protein
LLRCIMICKNIKIYAYINPVMLDLWDICRLLLIKHNMLQCINNKYKNNNNNIRRNKYIYKMYM